MNRPVLTLVVLAVIVATNPARTWSQQTVPAPNGTVPPANQALPNNGTIPGPNGAPANFNTNVPQQAQGAYGQAPSGNQNLGQANAANSQTNQPAGNPWLMDQGAQQQMQLTPQQAEALNRAYGTAMQQYQDAIGRLPANLSDAQRQQRLQRYQARFQQSYNRILDNTLANSRFRQRYDQLDRQYQGFGAFNDQQLQQQMNLSPQQRQQLGAMQGEYQQRLQQLQQRGSTPATRQEFAQLQQMARQQIGSVLNPQQQQNWSQMVGENYDFPMNSFNSGNTAQGQRASAQSIQGRNNIDPEFGRPGRVLPGGPTMYPYGGGPAAPQGAGGSNPVGGATGSGNAPVGGSGAGGGGAAKSGSN